MTIEEVKFTVREPPTRNTIKGRLHWLIYKAPPEPAELGSGLFLLLWGIWFTISPVSLTQSPTWQLLNVLPPRVWAGLSFVIGAVQLYSLLVNCRQCRRFTTYAIVIFWFLILSTKVATDLGSPTTPVYVMITGYALWVHYRVARILRFGEYDRF